MPDPTKARPRRAGLPIPPVKQSERSLSNDIVRVIPKAPFRGMAGLFSRLRFPCTSLYPCLITLFPDAESVGASMPCPGKSWEALGWLGSGKNLLVSHPIQG